MNKLIVGLVVVVDVVESDPPLCWIAGCSQRPEDCGGDACEACREIAAGLEAQEKEREEASWYTDASGNRVQCEVYRLEMATVDDPIMAMSGCAGEFFAAARRKDLRRGCPCCTELVVENAGEPGVVAALLRG